MARILPFRVLAPSDAIQKIPYGVRTHTSSSQNAASIVIDLISFVTRENTSRLQS